MTNAKPSLSWILDKAISARKSLTTRLLAEETDCWRILNGEADHRPGLTIDRYGDLILMQSFYDPIGPEEIDIIREAVNQGYGETFLYQLKIREKGETRIVDIPGNPALPAQVICRERGLKYLISTGRRGLDPHLFLDMRVARDLMGRVAPGRSLLNLFAYTCSMGIKAAACNAREVWNIDFSRSALDLGMKNRDLNGLKHKKIEFFKEDVIAATRQFSGLGIKGKARRARFLHFKPRAFDLVFLDPPTFARGKFGTVDILNDYQSIFKPALLCLEEGGTLIATHHHHSVTMDQWLALMRNAAVKANREIRKVELLQPHEDFPSVDGHSPLKIAALTI